MITQLVFHLRGIKYQCISVMSINTGINSKFHPHGRHPFRCKVGQMIANAFSEIVEVICIVKTIKYLKEAPAGRTHRALENGARPEWGREQVALQGGAWADWSSAGGVLCNHTSKWWFLLVRSE